MFVAMLYTIYELIIKRIGRKALIILHWPNPLALLIASSFDDYQKLVLIARISVA